MQTHAQTTTTKPTMVWKTEKWWSPMTESGLGRGESSAWVASVRPYVYGMTRAWLEHCLTAATAPATRQSASDTCWLLPQRNMVCSKRKCCVLLGGGDTGGRTAHRPTFVNAAASCQSEAACFINSYNACSGHVQPHRFAYNCYNNSSAYLDDRQQVVILPPAQFH